MASLAAELEEKAKELVAAYKKAGAMVATAESCTGGLIAASVTAISGSSAVLDRGFVTYSNEAKDEMLGVPAATISKWGAVSEETARAMAEGALKNSRAKVTVSVTGIAGPDGGSNEKPVGLVHFATARAGEPTHHERHVFPGDRDNVRRLTTLTAMNLLLDRIANDAA